MSKGNPWYPHWCSTDNNDSTLFYQFELRVYMKFKKKKKNFILVVYSLTLWPFKHWPHFVAARFLSEVPSPVDSAGQGHQSSSYWGQGSVHFYQCSSFTLTPQTRPWGSSLYILDISLKNIIMHMLSCYTQLYHYLRHLFT